MCDGTVTGRVSVFAFFCEVRLVNLVESLALNLEGSLLAHEAEAEGRTKIQQLRRRAGRVVINENP